MCSSLTVFVSSLMCECTNEESIPRLRQVHELRFLTPNTCYQSCIFHLLVFIFSDHNHLFHWLVPLNSPHSWCGFFYCWIPQTSDHPCWGDHCPVQHFSYKWASCGEGRTVPSLLYLFRWPARSSSETRLWWGKHHHQEWWWLVQVGATSAVDAIEVNTTYIQCTLCWCMKWGGCMCMHSCQPFVC